MKQLGLLLIAVGLASAALLWWGTAQGAPGFEPLRTSLGEGGSRPLEWAFKLLFSLTDSYVSDGGRRPFGWAFRLLLLSGGGLLVGWSSLRANPALRSAAIGVTGVCLAATAVAGVYSPHGSWTLAFTVPVGFALVVAALSGRDRKVEQELDAFATFPARQALGIDRYEAPYRADHAAIRGKAEVARLKRVESLPRDLAWVLPSIGGGEVARVWELHRGLAYVVYVEADAFSTADHLSVVAKLEERHSSMLARPIPIVEGKPVPNTGVVFKKDPEFSASFLVELPQLREPKSRAAAARALLSEPIRDALLELPTAWLRVDRDVLALTLYGSFECDRADALVETADVLFAEHGAGGGPSLLSPSIEGERKPKTRKPGAKPSSVRAGESQSPAR